MNCHKEPVGCHQNIMRMSYDIHAKTAYWQHVKLVIEICYAQETHFSLVVDASYTLLEQRQCLGFGHTYLLCTFFNMGHAHAGPAFAPSD